ncbi:MAG: 16S rRNA (cytidine(1402)-2'-O)-methyltransferase [Bifidobacteriaceae bacterium]|jgi:16S rRNA (cytidine1402-2'-O)-methyltransferase|nr:16S rRNA (cytidine(1402)-2'-O)-methyltransferase [Bifidobacteriaceae bacterium]
MTSHSPGIVLAATPIGNVADASDHLRELLGSADVIAAEDTRRLGALARRLGVTVKGRVISCHDHNERSRLDWLLDQARQGVVVVVTDAGWPLVCDPGFTLVRAAIAEGVAVDCAPGPSAVLTALALSGLPSARFAFDGFVPRAQGARAAWLDQLALETRTVVAFESARRLASTLSAAADRLGAERPAVIARELTKPHQELIRGSLGSLAAEAMTRELKGEVTLVIGGAAASASRSDPANMGQLVQEVEELVSAGASLKQAAAGVAGAAGVSTRALYQAVLDRR